jgi:hypothetical protein
MPTDIGGLPVSWLDKIMSFGAQFVCGVPGES